MPLKRYWKLNTKTSYGVYLKRKLDITTHLVTETTYFLHFIILATDSNIFPHSISHLIKRRRSM